MERKWTMLQLLLVLILITHSNTKEVKKVVCIIGAGPSGLISLKNLADNSEDFKPIVFEKNSDVGGLWIYSDSDVHSRIYKSLRTLSPKEFMQCPDYQKFYGENRSCVGHVSVVAYLRNYTDHFNLRRYIKFNTLVERITPILNADDRQSTKWLIDFRNLNSNESEKMTCDATMVATGPFQEPSIPKIPGIEQFHGRVLHSAEYRTPENFTGQTVVVLGAGISGLDIARDLSQQVKTVYLSHRHDKIKTEMPENIIQVAGVVAVNGNNLILQDGSVITADSFIYCTGYKLDLPFLDPSTGIEVHDKYLYPIYKRMVNIKYPTMGFIGFTRNIRSFCPQFHYQAKYYIALLQGKIELRSREEMLEDAKSLTSAKTVIQGDTYINQLMQDGKFEPLPEVYKKAAAVWKTVRTNDYRHACNNYNLVILDNGTIKVVKIDVGGN